MQNEGAEVSDQLYALACGPDQRANKFNGCIVNGVRFHTISRDRNLKSQNSGVSVEENHSEEDIDFYGVLTETIKLDYIKDCHVVLFKCDWFDLDQKKRRIQKNGHLTSINVNKFWYKSDPFILAIQATQVFYLNDAMLGKDWRVVQKFHHRHMYDVPEREDFEEESENDFDIYQEVEMSESDTFVEVEDYEGPLHRDDTDPDIIDAKISEQQIKQLHRVDEIGIDDVEDNDDDTIHEYYSEEDRRDGTIDEDSDLD